MFDDEDWNVDQVAESLDSSLFGPVTTIQHKNKKKKPKVTETDPNQSSLVKTGVKRKFHGEEEADVAEVKKKRKKKRKKKGTKFPDTGDDTSKANVCSESNEKEMVDKEAGHQNAKIMKNKKRSLGHGSVSVSVKDFMPGKDFPLTEMKSDKPVTVNSLKENDAENQHSSFSVEMKVKRKKKRKRKKDLNVSSEPSPPKENKLDDLQKTTEITAENGQMTRKERRNKRRKRNSKKNKYKHLALAIQEEKDKSPVQTTESSKTGKQEVKDRKSEKNSVNLHKKKRKQGRKEDFISDMLSPNRPDGGGNAQISKHMSEILTNIKSKKKPVQEKKLKEHSLVGSQVTDEAARTPKKDKGTPKQSFDVLRLKEIMSSDEKKMKTFMEEEDKKCAKRLSEVQQQSDNMKNVGNSETSRSKQKKHKGSGNGSAVMNTAAKQSKTPDKQGFSVKQLKETMPMEKKHIKVFDKVHEKRKKVNEGPEKSLKEKMQDRLNAARFRYLNEQLYTTTGDEAAALFADDDDAFHVYHQGYESQVTKWPVDPLTVIIRQIKARHKSPNTVVADMGCGSARLAQQLTGVKVHSFDFVAVNKWVTACNMSNVPLDNGSVDVVVFCLSLMGTNLVDYLLESNRILKIGGTVKIAEVESRFKKVGAFVSKVEKLGFELVTKDLSNKMFYMFDFKKDKNAKNSPFSPKIELDPCVYKKR